MLQVRRAAITTTTTGTAADVFELVPLSGSRMPELDVVQGRLQWVLHPEHYQRCLASKCGSYSHKKQQKMQEGEKDETEKEETEEEEPPGKKLCIS